MFYTKGEENTMKNNWPELSYAHAKETYETLLLWTQIPGKIQVVKLPWINHAWHVTLQVTSTGLATHEMQHEDQHFHIAFDFLHHRLNIITDSGENRRFNLADGLSVAEFYNNIFTLLADLGIQVDIYPVPNEVENAIPFYEDHTHQSYDANEAGNFHKSLLCAQDVFTEFRADFRGKCSPVHFFWGASDLAVSRFSGRVAPRHPGGIPHLPDKVVEEAYCREVSSAGFWPGSAALPHAAFYSYIYPEPEGFKEAHIEPSGAYYHKELGEFILPYETVQRAENPGKILLSFLQSTYNAAADLAKWDREGLEVIKGQ